jgi:hypothetical protein
MKEKKNEEIILVKNKLDGLPFVDLLGKSIPLVGQQLL